MPAPRDSAATKLPHRRSRTRPSARVVLGAVLLGSTFLALQWLRWPEPPGLDQSLFALYGHWMWRGLRLYRDLWDSKPPGIFVLYGVAARVAGTAHAAGLLDALAAAVAGLLCFRLLREAGRPAAWAAAVLAVFLPSAPPFGGPMVAGQAEPLLAPALLGAVLLARRHGWRSAAAAGLLLGGAACIKLVAVCLWPLAWVFAPPTDRRTTHRLFATLSGMALVPLVCAALLASQGTLQEAWSAVIVYPRAYATEMSNRIALAGALARAGSRLLRGLPLTSLLAAAGVVAGAIGLRVAARERAARTARAIEVAAPQRSALAWPYGVWLGLAIVGVILQRQMTGYQLLLLAPPLSILGGFGAAALQRLLSSAWRRSLLQRPSGYATLVVLAAALAIATASEGRWWARAYAPHLALASGRIAPAAFLSRLGGPGPAWLEAQELASRSSGVLRPGDGMLVWGLAPQAYLATGCRPVTRYAFHQTLLVEGSDLARRWPEARARRRELLQRFAHDAPRGVVVVRGDVGGLEPTDSEAELRAFPELRRLLEMDYRPQIGTRSYDLFIRRSTPP